MQTVIETRTIEGKTANYTRREAFIVTRLAVVPFLLPSFSFPFNYTGKVEGIFNIVQVCFPSLGRNSVPNK